MHIANHSLVPLLPNHPRHSHDSRSSGRRVSSRTVVNPFGSGAASRKLAAASSSSSSSLLSQHHSSSVASGSGSRGKVQAESATPFFYQPSSSPWASDSEPINKFPKQNGKCHTKSPTSVHKPAFSLDSDSDLPNSVKGKGRTRSSMASFRQSSLPALDSDSELPELIEIFPKKTVMLIAILWLTEGRHGEPFLMPVNNGRTCLAEHKSELQKLGIYPDTELERYKYGWNGLSWSRMFCAEEGEKVYLQVVGVGHGWGMPGDTSRNKSLFSTYSSPHTIMSYQSTSSDFELHENSDANDGHSDTASTTNDGVWSVDPSNASLWENSWTTISAPVDPPTERSEAKKWLRKQLGYSDSHDSGASEKLSGDYLDALKDAVVVRDDLHIRWNGPAGPSDPLADWETEAWYRFQVERVQNPDLPMPTLNAKELHRRRAIFFRRARALLAKLGHKQREIMELARARREVSPGSLSDELFLLRVNKNAQRQQIQLKADQAFPVVKALYFLTAVVIIHAI
ncbi:hypothetical protein K435DRAFT_880025 [Dendrothele bispora CBS 962.96]|uniref:Uncharacterized protein n=1 Tax=Dendrothele bispora (strain CBS 962.96) TaxID=1314807 RepID=A0A4S8KK42_DENBC|nr:hypothetical protein K435DRAFT_880025 [Dendrothele bispora CBS 962.96]